MSGINDMPEFDDLSSGLERDVTDPIKSVIDGLKMTLQRLLEGPSNELLLETVEDLIGAARQDINEIKEEKRMGNIKSMVNECFKDEGGRFLEAYASFNPEQRQQSLRQLKVSLESLMAVLKVEFGNAGNDSTDMMPAELADNFAAMWLWAKDMVMDSLPPNKERVGMLFKGLQSVVDEGTQVLPE